MVNSVYFGGWRDDADVAGDTTTAGAGDATLGETYTLSLDAEMNKRPSVAIMVKPWVSSGAYVTLPSTSTIRSHGQIPLIAWRTEAWGSGLGSLPSLSNANIASGAHDAAFLIPFAQAVKALNYPIMILIDEEPNGSWNSWFDATGVSFVNMWQHIVNVFNAQGARNVSWVWCINGIAPGGSFSNWWPGSAYVDWAGIDVFNTSYSQGNTWITFDQIVHGDGSQWGDSYDALLALDTTGKVRYCITSFSSDDRTAAGANNFAQSASWATDALSVQLPGGSGVSRDYSKIEMILWFDQNEPHTGLSDGADHRNVGGYPLGGNTARLAAFQGPNGIGGQTYYVAGGKFLLQGGIEKIRPYAATRQTSFFTNAVLMTAPNNLVGYWKQNDPSGTVLTDFSAGARNGAYNGGFTLAQPKIIPGTLDKCVLYNGSTGFGSVASNAAFSVPTTGQLTLMVVFKMAALPGSGRVCIFGKGGDSSNNFEHNILVYSTGIIEGDVYSLVGGTYSTAGSAGGVIVAGNTYIAFWSINQATSPISTLGFAQLGATSITALTSTDTPANTPAAGAVSLYLGKRGDGFFANAFISHAAIWNVALNTISMRELLKAASVRRDKPRNVVW